MFYIFNASGKCVASCNYEPNVEDLESRGEICVEDENGNEIASIILENGEITKKVIPPEPVAIPTLDELKAKKRIELDALTGQKITGGFNMLVNDINTKFDSDIETQITMQGIAINANTDDFKIKYPDGAPVRGIPDGKTKKEVLMLDGPAIIKFCANLSEHIGQCKQRGWELQQEVDVAENEEMLNNIKW